MPFNPVFIEKARKTVTDDTLRSDFKKDDRWKIARWLGGDDFTFWPENIIRLKKLCKAVDWPTDRTVFLDDDLLDDVAVLCIQLT